MAAVEKKPSLSEVLVEGKDDDMTTDEDESSEDYSASAGEAFDALKTDDREGFIQAFKAAVMSCK